jgi:ATP-dependent Clp protease protease subunit
MAATIDLTELLNKNAIDPIQYQYFKNLGNRRIIINDEITQDIIEMALLPLMELDTDGSGKPITILLNTNGGEIYSGFTLIDYIEKIKTPTTIQILGMAASMGALIAMAGKLNPNVKTVCSPFSVGLIHSGSQYMEGTTHAVRDTFKFSEKYESRIKAYILSHTNISEEMYKEIERQEFWMSSDDMLKYGIVSEII